MKADNGIHGIPSELLAIAIAGIVPWFVIAVNWRIVWRNYTTGKTGSLIPGLGGLSGSYVVWNIATTPAVRWFWWIPLVIDCGSIPLLLVTVLFWTRIFLDRWRRDS